MRNFSILVVDDDRGLARLIEKILRREDFNVTIANSAREAIEWSQEHPEGLMLIDLKLPDLDAKELIERLAANGEPPSFIIITGEGDERMAVEMMKRGALDYLIKDSMFLDLVPVVVRRSLTQLVSRRRLSEAEAQLKREYEFSGAILETSGALIIVVNAEGEIVRFNPACEILTGYRMEEVIGKSFWNIFLSEREHERSKQSLRDMLENQLPHQREGYMLTKTGEHRLISWSLTTLSNELNQAEFIIACGMDITEYRRLEREILQISEMEQKRIGQDLHDGLCQLLAGIDMMSTVLQRKLATKSPADSSAASDISYYTREAIDQARQLARGLSPVELETNGLMSALQELASTSTRIFGIDCIFSCGSPLLVEDNIRGTHLYRIAQESINNAVRHGGAKTVTVRLESDGESGMLVITDDGAGFPSQVSPTGMGLRSMRYRTDLLGGRFDIRNSESGGTIVTCTFPMASPPLNLLQTLVP